MKKVLLLDSADIEKAIYFYMSKKGLKVKEIVMDIRRFVPDRVTNAGRDTVEVRVEVEDDAR